MKSSYEQARDQAERLHGTTADKVRMPYRVKAIGCDDVTTVTVDLDDEEAAIVRCVVDRVTAASDAGCQPTMTIEKATP